MDHVWIRVEGKRIKEECTVTEEKVKMRLSEEKVNER
jgi:hypothetical protein